MALDEAARWLGPNLADEPADDPAARVAEGATAEPAGGVVTPTGRAVSPTGGAVSLAGGAASPGPRVVGG